MRYFSSNCNTISNLKFEDVPKVDGNAPKDHQKRRFSLFSTLVQSQIVKHEKHATDSFHDRVHQPNVVGPIIPRRLSAKSLCLQCTLARKTIAPGRKPFGLATNNTLSTRVRRDIASIFGDLPRGATHGERPSGGRAGREPR